MYTIFIVLQRSYRQNIMCTDYDFELDDDIDEKKVRFSPSSLDCMNDSMYIPINPQYEKIHRRSLVSN